MVPVFQIRGLRTCGTQAERDGGSWDEIQLTEFSEYDRLISDSPNLTLSYRDEDDDVVAVGSSDELMNRIDEIQPPYIFDLLPPHPGSNGDGLAKWAYYMSCKKRLADERGKAKEQPPVVPPKDTRPQLPEVTEHRPLLEAFEAELGKMLRDECTDSSHDASSSSARPASPRPSPQSPLPPAASEIFARIMQSIKSVSEAVGRVGADLRNDFPARAQPAFENVQSTLQAAIGALTLQLQTVALEASQKARQAAQSTREADTSEIDAAKAKLATLAAAIGRIAAQAGVDARSAARDIADEVSKDLKQGVEDGFGAVAEHARKVAEEVAQAGIDIRKDVQQAFSGGGSDHEEEGLEEEIQEQLEKEMRKQFEEKLQFDEKVEQPTEEPTTAAPRSPPAPTVESVPEENGEAPFMDFTTMSDMHNGPPHSHGPIRPFHGHHRQQPFPFRGNRPSRGYPPRHGPHGPSHRPFHPSPPRDFFNPDRPRQGRFAPPGVPPPPPPPQPYVPSPPPHRYSGPPPPPPPLHRENFFSVEPRVPPPQTGSLRRSRSMMDREAFAPDWRPVRRHGSTREVPSRYRNQAPQASFNLISPRSRLQRRREDQERREASEDIARQELSTEQNPSSERGNHDEPTSIAATESVRPTSMADALLSDDLSAYYRPEPISVGPRQQSSFATSGGATEGLYSEAPRPSPPNPFSFCPLSPQTEEEANLNRRFPPLEQTSPSPPRTRSNPISSLYSLLNPNPFDPLVHDDTESRPPWYSPEAPIPGSFLEPLDLSELPTLDATSTREANEVDECVARLIDMGYSESEDGRRDDDRLKMFAELSKGDILQAIEMLEEEQRAWKSRPGAPPY